MFALVSPYGQHPIGPLHTVIAGFEGDVIELALTDRRKGNDPALTRTMQQAADGVREMHHFGGPKTSATLYAFTDVLLQIVGTRRRNPATLRPLMVILRDIDERYAKLVQLLLLARRDANITGVLTYEAESSFTRRVAAACADLTAQQSSQVA